MKNLDIWEQVHECPQEALSEIKGGKLKGKSDISPIWRYKRLTELFGPAGKGWGITNDTYTVVDGANGEKAVMCQLTLWYKEDEKRCVPGQGGSMLIATEKGQLVTNDEAYKMAYTDAVSVACKQLGFAADVYWSKGSDSKYQRWSDDDPLGTGNTDKRLEPRPTQAFSDIAQISAKDYPAKCVVCGAVLTPAQKQLSMQKYGELLCPECQKKVP